MLTIKGVTMIDEKILAKNNNEYTEGVKGKYITVTK